MTVTVRSNPKAPASVAVGHRTFFVNAYTGQVLGEGAPGVRAFFRRVTDWHRWLGTSNENRATGRMITGASNLAFLVIVASGPFLWWPKKFTLTRIRAIVWFKGGLPSKARDFNWHNTIGIWSAIPLLVIVGSGVVMSYPWANNLVYRLAGEQPPAPGGSGGAIDRRRAEGAGRRPEAETAGRVERDRARDSGPGDTPREEARNAASVSLGAFVARAAAHRPAWRTLAIRLPLPSRGPVSVTVDEGDGGQPQKRGTLTLDRETGAVIKWEGLAKPQPAGAPDRGSDLHTRARSTVSQARPGRVSPRWAQWCSCGPGSRSPSVAS